MARERRAVRIPVERALAEHVERPSRDPEPAHAVMNPPRIEPLLRDQKTRSLSAEQRLRGNADVVVDDLGVVAVTAEAVPRMLHRRDVAQDLHAGRVGVDDEHRGALMGSRLGIGHGHHDQEVGDRAVRREPLVAVDDPVIAVADRRGLQQRRIGPRGVGLGHAERGLQVAREQRVQISVFLFGGSRQRDDLGVAGVGRGVAERERSDRRCPENLVHQPELHLSVSLTAEFRVQVRGPQPLGPDLVLERGDRAGQAVPPELLDQRLERPDLLANESAHPVELALELGLGGEIPGHRDEGYP